MIEVEDIKKGYVHQFEDHQESPVFPVTITDAVVDPNTGKTIKVTLDEELKHIEQEFQNNEGSPSDLPDPEGSRWARFNEHERLRGDGLKYKEDLFIDSNNEVKLADRDNIDGMGYVILRKDKSFAEQVTKENTIYEIRYEFDLNNQDIIIPNNCILKFCGGSIKNTTIFCNNTLFEGYNIINAILINTYIKGTICDYNFKFKQNSDITYILQNLLDVFSYAKIGPGTYYINKTIIINNDGTILEGSGRHSTTLVYSGEETNSMISTRKKTSESWYAISFNAIKNIRLTSNKLANTCIDNQGPSCTFENLYIIGFKDYGIFTENSWCSHINNCIITYCNVGIFLNESSHNTSIFECRIEANNIYDILLVGCAGVNITNCVLESDCKTSIYIVFCRDINIYNNYFEGGRHVKGSEIEVSYASDAYDDTVDVNTLIFIGNGSNWRNNKYLRFDAAFKTNNVNICNNHVEGATGYLACTTSCYGLNIKNNNIQGDKTVFLLPHVYNTTIYNLDISDNTSTVESENYIAKSIDYLYPTNLYYVNNDYSTQHIYGKCKLDNSPEIYLNNINDWNTVRTNYITDYKIDKFTISDFEVLINPNEISDSARFFGAKQIFPGKGLYCVELTTKIESLIDSEDIVSYEFQLFSPNGIHINSKTISPILKLGEPVTTKFYIYLDDIYFKGFSTIFKSTKSKNTYRFINPKIYKVGCYIPNNSYYLEASKPFQNVNNYDIYTKGISVGTISKYENTSKVCVSNSDNYDKWSDIKDGQNVNLIESNDANWISAILNNNTSVKMTMQDLAQKIKEYL